MTQQQDEQERATYVETPNGIFTAAGVWFHATEASLQAYAGPVLDRISLGRLISYAEVWLRSPETLALWSLPVLLAFLPPLPAALAALVVYLGWKVLGPSFTTLAGVAVLRILDVVWIQALYYVGALTWLAGGGLGAVVWTGLAGFIALRWGLVARLLDPLSQRLQAPLYEMPAPDQVLRGLIIRLALKHGLSLPMLDQMERQVADHLQQFGKKNRKGTK